MSFLGYSYYDSPDGKDLVKKMFYCYKKVSIIGFGLASTEIILNSKPIGYMNTAYRYGQLMGPMYVAASTFCVVTHLSTHIREKDDETNYAIGGFAAGALMGPLINQKLLGFWLGVGCAIIGAVKKNSKMHNWEFFPVTLPYRKPVHGDFRTPYRNWTLYDARPKGWKAIEARAE